MGADSQQVELVVITPAEVSAFVDGELGSDARRDVAACAQEDDRAACLMTAWHWQLARLHEAFNGVMHEPVPERLKAIVRPPEHEPSG